MGGTLNRNGAFQYQGNMGLSIELGLLNNMENAGGPFNTKVNVKLPNSMPRLDAGPLNSK